MVTTPPHVHACVRGCTTRNHTDDCLTSTWCPDHTLACRGCQPRPHNPCRGCVPSETKVGHYCQECADKFRTNLRDIPHLVTQVAQLPGGRIAHKQSAGDQTRRTTQVDQTSPSPAWDTADEVIRWAQAWAFIVSGRREYDPIRYDIAGLPVADLTSAVAHISNRLTQALTEDYHAALFEETTNLHRRLVMATGTDELTHRIKEPCPSCNQRTLIRDDGADKVECRNRRCKRRWAEHEYANLAHVAAS